MTFFLPARLVPAAAIAMAFALGGCVSGTTYGTGVSPGKQTMEDIVGLVSLTGKTKDPIDYKPRPPIVAPPSTAALPPPEDAPATAAAADWPKDPDAKGAGSGEPVAIPVARNPGFQPEDKSGEAAFIAHMKYGKQATKMYADAKAAANTSVDENGNPIRKTLSEPPGSYRVPDPTAPEEFTTPKKKKKWWQLGK